MSITGEGAAMNETPLIKAPSRMSGDEFMEVYGGVYEKSPWIAEEAFARQDIDTVEALHAAMKLAVVRADMNQQLMLIRSHPDLAVAAADLSKLTQESQSEQTGAGLKNCTPEEFAEFQKLNADYKTKFGFPFIIAVKGLTRHDILKAFRERMHSTREVEFKTALEQVHKIAWHRIMALSQQAS
jgi:2-oxo-4-hydroxy-4-carboxy-5-ureidoimidazoline decarboxylase